MPQLRILPGNVANMIAAGEVVQRPASVVKELMENALDAGATKVSVLVTDAGRTLIRVIDDGCGMSPDDAVLCFERHATSKLASEEDLNHILTYGFRGEALASIAAVAEVTLRTRRPEDEIGCEVSFAASQHMSTREVAAPSGSDFSVRNLFYNVPARRKFLKSDSVEMRHIVEEFTRVALTRPDVSFELRHGEREVFSLKPAQSLKFRILALLGTSVVGDVVDVMADTSLVRLSGFAGRPEAARKTAGNQFFFVNGRYFRSPYLNKAVQRAYEGLIPDGAFPSYFLYLDMDPEGVDVNISPTKSEVKFEDEHLVFQVLYAAVKEAIGRFAAAPDIDFDSAPAETMPVIGRQFDEYRPVSLPKAPVDDSYNPFEQGTFAKDPVEKQPSYSRYFERQDPGYGKLFEEQRAAETPLFLLPGGRYFAAPSATGLMVVNIRRASERILYERFLEAFRKEEPATQAVLFPVQVQVGVEGRLRFEEHAKMLASLGFDIAPFGEDAIAVNGVPQGYSAEEGKIRQMVADLEMVLTDVPAVLPQTVLGSLAEKFAILGASHGDGVTTPAAARQLLDALLKTENPERTSGGKKTLAIFPQEELDKKFQL
ncbi:MAG: DNA mismatch repair endonuclease MutL [Bacteroidales bacterium]|nr:DNA mismatch repair endonuclease MutL [Bacteroidales bacterium]